MILKIKFYELDSTNHENFRGSMSRFLYGWPFQKIPPQVGMTLIIPAKKQLKFFEARDKNCESFRFYLTHIIIDFRNEPSKDNTILVDKRLFYYGTANTNIILMKRKLLDHGWKENGDYNENKIEL